jgi:signal peptidase I
MNRQGRFKQRFSGRENSCQTDAPLKFVRSRFIMSSMDERIQEQRSSEALDFLNQSALPGVVALSSSAVWQFLVETFQTILLALVLYFMIDAVVARVRVENVSMKPTLLPDERLLVNKLAYRFGEVKRGDIIVFHFPANPSEDYIKRVIGLPGDQVQIRENKVYINGQELREDYIAAPVMYDGEWLVPPDSLFVLGDNRNQSSDSHSWGFVPMENVIGKALVVYWPLDKVKFLTHSNSNTVFSAAD